MFVQLIEGRTTDAEGLKRQGDRWQAEVRPGAIGYLGVTSGVTDDGRSIAIVRFESEDAARANGERPEQSSWWADTAKYFEGDVGLHGVVRRHRVPRWRLGRRPASCR